MAEGPNIAQQMFAQGIGTGGGNPPPQDIKPLGIATKIIPNSQGIDYYNTPGLAASMIMKSSPTRFGVGTWLDGLLKYVTREATPVHANETNPSIAAAAAVEPTSHNVSFSDLVGDAGSMGSYSVADVAGASAPIGPRMSGAMELA